MSEEDETERRRWYAFVYRLHHWARRERIRTCPAEQLDLLETTIVGEAKYEIGEAKLAALEEALADTTCDATENNVEAAEPKPSDDQAVS